MTCNTDLDTWLHDFGNDIFRILVYRKRGQYTPYEMKNKFSDESLYISNDYNDIVNIGLHFILKNVRPYAAPCSEA